MDCPQVVHDDGFSEAVRMFDSSRRNAGVHCRAGRGAARRRLGDRLRGGRHYHRSGSPPDFLRGVLR